MDEMPLEIDKKLLAILDEIWDRCLTPDRALPQIKQVILKGIKELDGRYYYRISSTEIKDVLLNEISELFGCKK